MTNGGDGCGEERSRRIIPKRMRIISLANDNADASPIFDIIRVPLRSSLHSKTAADLLEVCLVNACISFLSVSLRSVLS